jgi:hypothetical protein
MREPAIQPAKLQTVGPCPMVALANVKVRMVLQPSGLALDSTLIRYLVKTNLGAERYCGAEIQEQLAATFPDCPSAERGGVSPYLNGVTSSNAIPCWTVMARPCGMDGYVAVCSNCAMEKEMNGIPLASASSLSGGDPSKENLVPLLLQLRSAHYVLQYHAHFDLKDCYRHVTASSSLPDSSHKDDDEEENVNLLVDGEMLYEYCKQRLLDGTLSVSSLVDASSFRVTCERIGIQHAFAAPQVEQYVERHLIHRLNTLFAQLPTRVLTDSGNISFSVPVKWEEHFPNFMPTVGLAWSITTCKYEWMWWGRSS